MPSRGHRPAAAQDRGHRRPLGSPRPPPSLLSLTRRRLAAARSGDGCQQAPFALLDLGAHQGGLVIVPRGAPAATPLLYTPPRRSTIDDGTVRRLGGWPPPPFAGDAGGSHGN